MHSIREHNKCSACSAIQVTASVFTDALDALTDRSVCLFFFVSFLMIFVSFLMILLLLFIMIMMLLIEYADYDRGTDITTSSTYCTHSSGAV